MAFGPLDVGTSTPSRGGWSVHVSDESLVSVHEVCSCLSVEARVDRTRHGGRPAQNRVRVLRAKDLEGTVERALSFGHVTQGPPGTSKDRWCREWWEIMLTPSPSEMSNGRGGRREVR